MTSLTHTPNDEGGTLNKYRKRPVVIEAHQWFKNGDHPDDHSDRMQTDNPNTSTEVCEGEIVRYFRRPEPEYAGQSLHDKCGIRWHDHGWIDTLEGGHTVCPGDWIITGVQGEHYPCKPDIFAATYEVADESTQPPARVLREGGLYLPPKLLHLLDNVLRYYGDEFTYQPERVGGILEGCPRGETPISKDNGFGARQFWKKLKALYDDAQLNPYAAMRAVELQDDASPKAAPQAMGVGDFEERAEHWLANFRYTIKYGGQSELSADADNAEVLLRDAIALLYKAAPAACPKGDK